MVEGFLRMSEVEGLVQIVFMWSKAGDNRGREVKN